MKAIVITTIYNPSDAVKAYSKINNYQLIVVGDEKTPKRWECVGADYIPLQDQFQTGEALSKILPTNHYCRKMFGYLKAIHLGAEVIIDTDDDNYPKTDWGFPKFDGKFSAIVNQKGFVNIYKIFSDEFIWPRGFPLDMVRNDFDKNYELIEKDCKVGVWQGLSDNDPDVDAIYRLIINKQCFFSDHQPVVLENGTICPYNSQNTAIRKELFSLLYLPAYVNFRFTDILRGLVAQPIMWLYGYSLGFTKATVSQNRNAHDIMKDFSSEIPVFQYSKSIINVVMDAININESIEANLHNAYHSLQKEKIVSSDEMFSLDAWLNDLQKVDC